MSLFFIINYTLATWKCYVWHLGTEVGDRIMQDRIEIIKERMESPTLSNVILVGDFSRQFMMRVEGMSYKAHYTSDFDFVSFIIKPFKFWIVIKNLVPYTLVHQYAKAIIYCSPNPEIKADFENKRNPIRCIAISFDKRCSNEWDCVNRIPFFIEENETSYERIKAKSTLVLCSQYDGNSIFYCLPEELKKKIICCHYRLYQRSIFKSPKQTTCKPGDENESPSFCNFL